jgi:hypothetical protein
MWSVSRRLFYCSVCLADLRHLRTIEIWLKARSAHRPTTKRSLDSGTYIRTCKVCRVALGVVGVAPCAGGLLELDDDRSTAPRNSCQRRCHSGDGIGSDWRHNVTSGERQGCTRERDVWPKCVMVNQQRQHSHGKFEWCRDRRLSGLGYHHSGNLWAVRDVQCHRQRISSAQSRRYDGDRIPHLRINWCRSNNPALRDRSRCTRQCHDGTNGDVVDRKSFGGDGKLERRCDWRRRRVGYDNCYFLREDRNVEHYRDGTASVGRNLAFRGKLRGHESRRARMVR